MLSDAFRATRGSYNFMVGTFTVAARWGGSRHVNRAQGAALWKGCIQKAPSVQKKSVALCPRDFMLENLC